MLSILVATLFLPQQVFTIPAFKDWDGKAWSGISIGTTEKDLKKQVKTSKTVGADPASIRINTDKKGWVLAAILTDVKQRGSVSGLTLELEREEPISSLEAIEQELGKADYNAYSPLRYSDWGLVVWKRRGIAAVIAGGNRPRVQKMLLSDPTGLEKNVDVWDRSPNRVRDVPRVPVYGFDIGVSCDPSDSGLEATCRDALRRDSRRLLDRYDGLGWEPVRRDGQHGSVTFRIKKKAAEYAIDGSVSVSHRDDLGYVSGSQSSSATAKRDIEISNRIESMFDDMMRRLGPELDQKYRRPMWEAEWRLFTALCRPKA